MLHELYLKNYIILKMKNKFRKGLNVITGETGSGKSIIIDAIEILCGGRFVKEDIKTGANKAFIEGVFEIKEYNNELDKILDDYGISRESDNILLIQREVNLNGRSLCRINGQTVTLSMLKNITQNIIDIVAQNEHQQLFKHSSHINLIDNFGTAELLELKKELDYLTNEIESVNKILDNLYGTSQERERKLDLSKYEIDEIEKANIKIDELDKLKNRKAILNNAEKLYNVISNIYEILYSGPKLKQKRFDDWVNV